MANSTGRARNEAVRLAILDATRHELAERGWDRLSFERIAATARVGKQTLYRWWPTKGALVSEMVVDGGILPVGPVAATGDVHEDVIGWMRAVGRVLDDPDAASVLQAVLAAVAEDAALSTRYDERVTTPARDGLAARLHRAVGDGELPPSLRIDVVTQSLLAAVLWCLTTRRRLDETFARELIATVLPRGEDSASGDGQGDGCDPGCRCA